MKTKLLFLIFTFLALSLTIGGCSGKHCVKVTGGYNGVSGDIEYCYDAAESANAGVSSFSDSNGQKNYMLTADQINQLNKSIVEDNANLAISTRYNIHPVRNLLGLIKKKDEVKEKKKVEKKKVELKSEKKIMTSGKLAKILARIRREISEISKKVDEEKKKVKIKIKVQEKEIIPRGLNRELDRIKSRLQKVRGKLEEEKK